MNQPLVYDVFLSHRPLDAALAAYADEQFRLLGLEVLHAPLVMQPDQVWLDELRSGLAECLAVAMVVTPGNADSPTLAFVAGAAMAWGKPVYVLFDGLEADRLSLFLRQFHVAPLTATATIAGQIRQAQAPLTTDQQELLKQVYLQTGVPTDQLLLEPQARANLGRLFAERSGADMGAARLLRELLNLRKRGQLPRLAVPSLAG